MTCLVADRMNTEMERLADKPPVHLLDGLSNLRHDTHLCHKHNNWQNLNYENQIEPNLETDGENGNWNHLTNSAQLFV